MRKFLVVLDDSRECLNAMRFAALRAAHTGAGVQILSIGVVGEYIGRIYEEVKRRPLYLVDETAGGEAPPAAGDAPAPGGPHAPQPSTRR